MKYTIGQGVYYKKNNGIFYDCIADIGTVCKTLGKIEYIYVMQSEDEIDERDIIGLGLNNLTVDIPFTAYPIYENHTILGLWLNELKNKKLPTNVFFNDNKKTTVIKFDDETIKVKCGKDDTYSRRIGFLEAYFQATCGMSKTQAKKYLEKIVKDKEVKI